MIPQDMGHMDHMEPVFHCARGAAVGFQTVGSRFDVYDK